MSVCCQSLTSQVVLFMLAFCIRHCIPLPSSQKSKSQASGGVVVSIGWGNGSGWQWNTKQLSNSIGMHLGINSQYNNCQVSLLIQLPDYLSHVDRRLSQEKDRLLHYLHQSTRYCIAGTLSQGTDLCHLCRKPLILCVEKQLIGEHEKEILDKGNTLLCAPSITASAMVRCLICPLGLTMTSEVM